MPPGFAGRRLQVSGDIRPGWSGGVVVATKPEIPRLIFDLPVTQETGVGANPVQIEVGDFDEAIEIVEDEVVESE